MKLMEKRGNYPKRYRYTEEETDRIIEILSIIEEYRKASEIDETLECINSELLYGNGEINYVTRCKRQTCPLCRENRKYKTYLKLREKINEQKENNKTAKWALKKPIIKLSDIVQEIDTYKRFINMRE